MSDKGQQIEKYLWTNGITNGRYNMAKEYILRFSVTSTFCIYPCIYSRVNSCVKSDEHVLEELETEGERQLKSLLQHQLDTSVSIEE